MNERIKEFRFKAAEYANERKPLGITKWNELRDEKFAELIVRECIKESMDEIVSDEDIDYEKDPLIREYLKGNNQGIVDAVIRFRNHFGVKE